MKAPFRFWLLGIVALSATAVSSLATAASYSNSQSVSESTTQLSIAQTSNTPAQANLSNFPHWRISLVNQVEQSPDFMQFHQQLWSAVHHRDAKFIRSIVTPQTTLGSPDQGVPLSSFKIDNPEAPFWRQLEKAISKGCVIESNSPIPNRGKGSNVWLCPNVMRGYEAAQKNRPAGGQYTKYGHVVIVGENVNVRKEPNTSSPVVGVVSNEIISFDNDRFEKRTAQMQKLMSDPLNGWTPVILPNGKRGFVQSRYAYQPLGHRTVFVKSGGKWQLRAFVIGD